MNVTLHIWSILFTNWTRVIVSSWRDEMARFTNKWSNLLTQSTHLPTNRFKISLLHNGVQVFLHSDVGYTIALASRCVDTGFENEEGAQKFLVRAHQIQLDRLPGDHAPSKFEFCNAQQKLLKFYFFLLF